jgi:hypothetical protein
MPKDIREYHRFLKIGESIQNARKIIIGSFSVYSLTEHIKSSIDKHEKNEGGLDFFYGSQRNQLWSWYKLYFDNEITLKDRNSVINSLEINCVAITDVIKSCERKDYSALDKALTKLEWNETGIFNLICSGAQKAICTSKWVLQKVEKEVLEKHGYVLDAGETDVFQKEIFHPIPYFIAPKHPIAKVYSKSGLKMYLASLPSPGGNSFRKLDLYGFDKTSTLNNREFLHAYVKSTFKWFAE